MKMSDATRRGLRTALQLAASLLASGGIVGVLKLCGVEVTAEAWAAISGVLLPFVTVLQNSLEDADTIPALLKAPASDGADPVPPA